MFLVGKVSGLVENFNCGVFLDTVNVIYVRICLMVLLAELYLLMSLSVTLAIFQAHSNV